MKSNSIENNSIPEFKERAEAFSADVESYNYSDVEVGVVVDLHDGEVYRDLADGSGDELDFDEMANLYEIAIDERDLGQHQADVVVSIWGDREEDIYKALAQIKGLADYHKGIQMQFVRPQESWLRRHFINILRHNEENVMLLSSNVTYIFKSV